VTSITTENMNAQIKKSKKKEAPMSPPPHDYDPFDSLRRGAFSDEEYQRCFRHFDSQKQGFWTREDFRQFLSGLFSNKRRPYLILSDRIDEYFRETDYNHDGKIDYDEFIQAWRTTIKCAVRPISALVIVDVQNDFISGSLALHSCPANHQGEEVVPIINRVIRDVNFDVVAYTYDCHPLNHISFYENRHLRKALPESPIKVDNAHVLDTVVFAGPPNLADSIEQVLWPAHCIQKTPGADLHPDLIRVDSAIHVYKGTNPEIDSYSAFWDNMKLSKTSLDDQLKERFVTDVYVVGLATDVCVAATALHAVENNYRTVLIEDACRGVNEHEIEVKRAELNENGCIFVDSDVVPGMVAGEDRRPEVARSMFVENLKSLGRYQSH
jgi:nicotinamidase-related amidase